MRTAPLRVGVVSSLPTSKRGHKSPTTARHGGKRSGASYLWLQLGKFFAWLDGGACSLYIAAQFLSAETCRLVGCGFCHSIKRASKRRRGKSCETQTLEQTGKVPCPLAASTATPKPRVESSNLSAPATKIPDFERNREFSLFLRIIRNSTRSSRSIKSSILCRLF